MSIDAGPTAAPTAQESGRRPLVVAGWAALLAALCYLVQPLVGLLVASSEPAFDTPEFLAAHTWLGPAEAVAFGGIGLSNAVLVSTLGVLFAGRRPDAAVLARVTTAAGLLSSAAWALTAGMSVGRYSPIAIDIADSGIGVEAQRAALQGYDIVLIGLVSAAGLGAGVWLAGVAFLGRGAGVAGWPLTVVSASGAAVILAPVAVSSVPFGVVVLMPVWLVMGIALLRRARRVADPAPA